MDKQTVVYPDNGMLFITKNKCCEVTERHRRILSALLLSERSQSKKNPQGMIPTSGKDKTMETVNQ